MKTLKLGKKCIGNGKLEPGFFSSWCILEKLTVEEISIDKQKAKCKNETHRKDYLYSNFSELKSLFKHICNRLSHKQNGFLIYDRQTDFLIKTPDSVYKNDFSGLYILGFYEGQNIPLNTNKLKDCAINDSVLYTKDYKKVAKFIYDRYIK